MDRAARILIIDDEMGMREGCRRALTPHGFEVTTAEHGVEIDCREPLPVQADGDLIKETPVTIRLVQGAVGVVVPQLPESADN